MLRIGSKYMSKTRTYSLKQILQYAYQLRESMGPVDISTMPQAMILANEKEIVISGGKVNIPWWRREQLKESLRKRYPESYYYAVENGVVPIFEGGAKKIERS